ncbi:hypothetical protein HMPREF2734_00835 [Corynebacterium sp. HMSC055D05]|nr:hypothetical protein HMPREF2734_00835 [Corynebacterium sp. HMSC055D05]
MIINLGVLEESDLRSKIFSVEKVFGELQRTELQIHRNAFSSGGQAHAEELHGYQQRLLGNLRTEVFDIFDWVTARGHTRSIETALLPPNLRDYSDHVSSLDVFDFVEQSGIPIYGVPRGGIALQLIEADTTQKRRFLLNRYSSQILDDCEAAIAASKANSVEKLRPFVEEALEATRAGFTKAAQALFTTVLDTLLMNCWKTDIGMKKKLGHRKRSGAVPEEFEELTVREALVWLPVWNSHSEYWPNQNFPAPYEYSRHASVHHVSAAQYSKRNCVQAAMLVSSIFLSR